MSIIQFENGTKVKFDGNPTPQDVDFVAQQVGIQPTKMEPTKPTEEPKKTFGKKVSNTITKIFPGKQVGEAIGTLAGYIATPKEAKQYYDLSAPNPLQVAGDIAQGALMLGTGGVATPTTAVSKIAGTSAPLLSKIATRTAKTVGGRALQNTAIGAGFGATGGIAEGKPIGEVAKETAIGGVLGAGLGLGVEALGAGMSKLARTPENLALRLDNHIKDIFKGTSADIQKINDSAFKAKKGLELLQKESGSIKIPNSKAPLGLSLKSPMATKPFDLQKSSPNELLSAVLEMDKKIATRARSASTKASEVGLKIDTSEARDLLLSNLDITKATRNRLIEQLDRTQGDPLKIHNWIQDVNIKYGKRFQNGTIEDNLLSKTVNDVAENLRGKLNTIVDRKGYAEAYGNNQELKRMILSIAKKANKNVNFGDITSDAGLDMGISILTGNPAYMARTLGSSLFKGIISKVKNNAGLRSFRKAGAIAKELPTKTKLPSNRVKLSKLNKLGDIKKLLVDKSKMQGGYIESASYKGESDLTTKILRDLEGKTTVSKQYILDATNRGELKQVERDLIRDILEKETSKGTTLNVGMNIGDGTTKLTKEQIVKEIEKLGIKIKNSQIKQSNTEATFIPELSRSLTKKELFTLSKNLKQDAIAQLSDGIGLLEGPKAADWGGKFNPEYYINPKDTINVSDFVKKLKTKLFPLKVNSTKTEQIKHISEAFGNVQLGAVETGALVSGAGIGLANLLKKKDKQLATTNFVPEQDKSYFVADRNAEITPSDNQELAPVLFGEISSDRPIEKQELEARVILNTALNRIKEYKKHGKDYTLKDVLSMPNQYQAYGGNEYLKYKNDNLDYLSNKKKDNIDSILAKLLTEIENGTFKDNTKGAFYYQHNPDGSIEFDSKKPLFK